MAEEIDDVHADLGIDDLPEHLANVALRHSSNQVLLSVGSDRRGMLECDGPREEHVVFQVDVTMQIALEFRQVRDATR